MAYPNATGPATHHRCRRPCTDPGEEAIKATGVKQEWASNPYAMAPVLEFNRRLVEKAAALSGRAGVDGEFTARDVELALFAAEHAGAEAGGGLGRNPKSDGNATKAKRKGGGVAAAAEPETEGKPPAKKRRR